MGLLTIVYQDDAIVAIDKPCGLLVHRTRISRDHTFAVQLLRDQLGRFVHPLHRLDRPTSGVLVFALDADTAAALAAAWQQGKVRKRYLAVVRGTAPESGSVDRPLREEAGAEALPAFTEYVRLAAAEVQAPAETARFSLLEVRPLTGRMHQIRRHMKHAGHPVLGDTRHGDTRRNAFFREHVGVARLMLHCAEVAFDHPLSGQRLVIRAPVPREFVRTAAALGWQAALAAFAAPGETGAPTDG